MTREGGQQSWNDARAVRQEVLADQLDPGSFSLYASYSCVREIVSPDEVRHCGGEEWVVSVCHWDWYLRTQS